MEHDVQVYPDPEALAQGAAALVLSIVRDAVQARGQATLALAGGSTPGGLYRALASPPCLDEMPWRSLDLFWGDERWVPPDHAQSNYRLARDTLLAHSLVPDENVHPVPTWAPSPADAARQYEATLRSAFQGLRPSFDLVLLGMGADGHVASLFPGSPSTEERDRWVIAVEAPAVPASRVTLTLEALNGARAVLFLVSGRDKAGAIRAVLVEGADLPATRIAPPLGRVHWLLDQEAAVLLSPDAGPRPPLLLDASSDEC